MRVDEREAFGRFELDLPPDPHDIFAPSKEANSK